MTWLTWRQLRTQALVAWAGVVVAAIVLAVTGPRLASLAATAPHLFDLLTATDRRLFYAGIAVAALAPAVIGAFWGAPLVAREFEAGTHLLAWSQSVTRTRWLATKLGITVLAAGAAVSVLSLAVTWWSSPLDGSLSSGRGGLPDRLTPVSFAMRGMVPVAYTVFALVLGVAVGLVLRRPIAAVAVTFALYLVVQVAVPLWVRPHLIAPERVTLAFSRETLAGIALTGSGTALRVTLHTADPHDWVLSQQTVDPRGKATALPTWLSDCLPGPDDVRPLTGTAQAQSPDTCLARLDEEGYRQRVTYQPKDRFWPLQWAESAFYLAASGLLVAFSFRRIRAG